MRSIVMVGRLVISVLFKGQTRRTPSISTPLRNADGDAIDHALYDATPTADAASFQNYSECFRLSSGFLGGRVVIFSRYFLLEATT
jgi:hypothetical protein